MRSFIAIIWAIPLCSVIALVIVLLTPITTRNIIKVVVGVLSFPFFALGVFIAVLGVIMSLPFTWAVGIDMVLNTRNPRKWP
jgi:uncharacterized membrane protein